MTGNKELIAALLLANQRNTGQPDQGIFQAPPDPNLPPIVDPRMSRSPGSLPGDYSKLPMEVLPPGVFIK